MVAIVGDGIAGISAPAGLGVRHTLQPCMLERPVLSLSLAGLSRDADANWGSARATIAWAAEAGCRAVQLDAAAPGLRARDLDRSGRRDLAAFLRRSQLTLSGLDLWIPPEHFTDPARSDRAMDAALAAIELAAEVGGLVAGASSPVVSLSLPEGLAEQARAALIARAEATGVRLADHAVRGRPAESQPPPDPDALLAIGIDPAAHLMAGLDPAAAVLRAGRGVASARLSDATTIGRIAPGSPGGRLDQLAYLVALATAGYNRALVLDVRGIMDQQVAIVRIMREWETESPPAWPRGS
jgi:sugar phosphate isomerase/epimerase